MTYEKDNEEIVWGHGETKKESEKDAKENIKDYHTYGDKSRIETKTIQCSKDLIDYIDDEGGENIPWEEIEGIAQLGIVRTPKVITLCGSTRFKDQFESEMKRLTLEGNIVISVGLFGHLEGIDMNGETKKMLDELHKRKIDLSDEIFVINVGGYIGKSTSGEIEYAKKHEKKIRYLE